MRVHFFSIVTVERFKGRLKKISRGRVRGTEMILTIMFITMLRSYSTVAVNYSVAAARKHLIHAISGLLK